MNPGCIAPWSPLVVSYVTKVHLALWSAHPGHQRPAMRNYKAASSLIPPFYYDHELPELETLPLCGDFVVKTVTSK